eukprot:CAMPEP_0202688784 /NCGR_PEP_ID=MMETSP1385-20130828/4219_1 /ASSEMBLY_ACC=CAM_ASM_000861 /TAXON_ID=933848 /ORGANISM="Elphidium margaritaceum" /LENGTH=346 /DNA_ID=CAMNT_0049343825 /DNA_START=31 /DNA_END=1071 /DNA_ORIENTATION=+
MTECGNCKASAARCRCSGCNMIYYCNKDCQRKHWLAHKKQCNFWKQKKAKKNQEDKQTSKKDADTSDKPVVFMRMQNDGDEQKCNLNDQEIKDAFDLICDPHQPGFTRINKLTALLYPPPSAEQFAKIEKQGLWQAFDTVLDSALNYVQNPSADSMSQKFMDNQMMPGHFLTAIVMLKKVTPDGTDTVDEQKTLKLFARTNFWVKNMEMIGMKSCHVEYKRLLFRVLTLVFNYASCGKYAIEHFMNIQTNAQHKALLMNLIALCNDDVDDAAHNALQGLCNQVFCQIYIFCEELKISPALKQFMDANKNMYFDICKAMARSQMKKGSALSINEWGSKVKEELSNLK